MYNRVIIMGRITRDLELKTTPAGVPVTSFSVAVDRKYSKGDEKQTDFFDCVAWRNTAEFICRYFGKGALIHIEGALQTRSYTDKNGNDRRVVEIVVDNVSFTGEKREPQQGYPGYAPQYQPQPQYQPSPQSFLYPPQPPQAPAQPQTLPPMNPAEQIAQGYQAQGAAPAQPPAGDYPFPF